MAVATVLLVRYGGGYTRVVDAAAAAVWGHKEGFLQLGGVSDLVEAQRVATAILAFQNAPRVATTLGIEPTGAGDEPYDDFGVGDTISAPEADGTTATQRVVSLTVAEDDQGDVSFATELKASFLLAEEAFNRQLKKLLNGSMRGQTQASNPLPTGSVTRADIGDSLGALRAYTNAQLLVRPTQALTTAIDGLGTTPPSFDPATDQELTKDFSLVGTMGASGDIVVTIPDGGFPTGLLNVIGQLGDPAAGPIPYFVTVVNAGCSNTQVEFLVFDASGTAYPNGGAIRLNIHAVGW